MQGLFNKIIINNNTKSLYLISYRNYSTCKYIHNTNNLFNNINNDFNTINNNLKEYIPTYIKLPDKNNNIKKYTDEPTRKDWQYPIPLGLDVETDANLQGGDRNLYFNTVNYSNIDNQFNKTRLFVNPDFTYFKLLVSEQYALRVFSTMSQQYEMEAIKDPKTNLFKIKNMICRQFHEFQFGSICPQSENATYVISQLDQESFDKLKIKLSASTTQKNDFAWEYSGKQGEMVYKREEKHGKYQFWVPPAFSPKLAKSPDGIVLNYFRFYPLLAISKLMGHKESDFKDGFGISSIVFIPKQ